MIADKGDILVTTPISKSAEAALEAEEIKRAGAGFYKRYMSARPKRTGHGNRIFYTDQGYVRGFAKITVVRPNEEDDGTGFIIWSDALSWTWIKPIEQKGFQGFRYVDGMEFEVIGNWLDPMPILERID